MKLKRHSRRSSGLKVHFSILFCLIFVFAVAGSALAATKLTNTVDGLTATLSVSPRMADLLLVDAATGMAVTDGAVTATVVTPDGQRLVKELIGMKMGEVYSYMNSLDMSAKGIYTFHIIVRVGEKSVKFDFKSGAM